MKQEEKEQQRPMAYPKPTETDTQNKEQGEYIERQSSRRTTQSEGADSKQDIEQMRSGSNEQRGGDAQSTEGNP